MNKRLLRIIVVGGGVVAVLLVLRKVTSGTAQTIAPVPQGPDGIGNNDAGRLLRNFLANVNAAGPNAETDYQAALAALRTDPSGILTEIMRAEHAANETDYPTRWSLVHAAAELRDPAALEFLSSLIRRPIPPERSADPHSFSTVGEETILRTTAVDGVRSLATADVAAARDALWTFLDLPSLSIRRASVQALLAIDQSAASRSRLASRLPSDQQFLLNVKPMDVREVPQIGNPEEHLLGQAGRAIRPPSLSRDSAESRRTPPTSRANPAPRVR